MLQQTNRTRVQGRKQCLWKLTLSLGRGYHQTERVRWQWTLKTGLLWKYCWGWVPKQKKNHNYSESYYLKATWCNKWSSCLGTSSTEHESYFYKLRCTTNSTLFILHKLDPILSIQPLSSSCKVLRISISATVITLRAGRDPRFYVTTTPGGVSLSHWI